jgi:hypothetical protein
MSRATVCPPVAGPNALAKFEVVACRSQPVEALLLTVTVAAELGVALPLVSTAREKHRQHGFDGAYSYLQLGLELGRERLAQHHCRRRGS